MKYAMVMPWKVSKLIADSLPVVETQKRAMTTDTKAEYAKRARRGMKGMALSWIDENPFDDNAKIFAPMVDHVNPTQKLICEDMWNRCKDWILNTEFTWLVRMVVVFDGAKDQPDYYFDFTGALNGDKSKELNGKMADAYDEAHKANASFKDGHKNKGVYLQTEFLAQIVGV
jgi:hypothetical protein